MYYLNQLIERLKTIFLFLFNFIVSYVLLNYSMNKASDLGCNLIYFNSAVG